MEERLHELAVLVRWLERRVEALEARQREHDAVADADGNPRTFFISEL